METLILNSSSKKKITLIKQLAIQLGIEVTTSTKALSEPATKKGSKKTTVKQPKVLAELDLAFKQLKMKKEGKIKFNSIDNLLNEK